MFDAIDESLWQPKKRISVKELPKALRAEKSKNYWSVVALIEKYHTLKTYIAQNSVLKIEAEES